jgi:hypothetical protein
MRLRAKANGMRNMVKSDTVTVFSFRVFDVEAGGMRLSRYKATRETVKAHFGGEVLEGTGQDMALTELDEFGRYGRIATGWGELR